MSAVVDSLGDIVDAVIGAVVLSSLAVFTITFPFIGITLFEMSKEYRDFLSGQLANTLVIFGIGPEDVVSVNISDTLLFSEDTNVSETLTQIALYHAKSDTGIITLMSQATSRTRASYNNYFYKGESGQYSPGLPDTTISSTTIPREKLKIIIDAEYGISATIVTATRNIPTQEDYIYSKLYTSYKYDSLSNSMKYLDVIYNIITIDYDYGSNTYEVIIARKSTVVTTTTITVVEEDDIATATTVVEVKRVLAEGEIIESTTTSSAEVSVGTPSSVEKVYVEDSMYEPYYLTYDASANVNYYVVSFYTVDNSKLYHWVYEIGSEAYPEIEVGDPYITNLEMLPIVALRNNKISITEDISSPEYLEAKDILATIGLSPDTLLESIESNPDVGSIESAHIHFGVDPKVSDPIIAKALFSMFEFIYNDSLVSVNADSYTIVTTEAKYNATLSWKGYNKTTNIGIVAELNECTNEIVNIPTGEVTDNVLYNSTIPEDLITNPKTLEETVRTLVLQKQVTGTEYEEYRITYLTSSTFIQNAGFYGVATGTMDVGVLTIPISKFLIDKLTPIEQMELLTRSLRLSVYAIQITHLKYYQTEAFATLIQVIMYIVAIVIFVFTWWSGGATSAAFIAAVEGLLYALAAAYAFKLLLDSTDIVWLKAVITIIYIAVAVYAGGGEIEGFISSDTLLFSVSAFTEMSTSILVDKYEDLELESQKFIDSSTAAFKTLEEKSNEFNSYLSTDFVSGLATTSEIQKYIIGPDFMIYRAVGMQYEFGLLKGGGIYDNIYDYDKYYKVGMV